MPDNRIRDIAPQYINLCVKKDALGNIEKIWGIYCTRSRYDWDHSKMYPVIDDAFIFSGPVMGPFRYTFSVVNDRNSLYKYYRRRLNRENYKELNIADFTNNPVYDKVRELVSKKMLWKILQA